LWLVDEVLRERGSLLRTGDMTAANRDALEGYSWRGNFVELRQVADWLIAVDKTGSIRAAAELLDMPRSTLARRLDEIGVTLPLTVTR
jgi:DNA-binding NtrC family response regulator